MGLLHLSVRPPYATAIIRWGATQLSRQTPPPQKVLGERIAIHSTNIIYRRDTRSLGTSIDEMELYRTMKRLRTAGALPAEQDVCLTQILGDMGGILGTVRVVGTLFQELGRWYDQDRRPAEMSPWAVRSFPYIWLFEDPEPFAEIRQAKSRNGFWELRE